MASRTRRHNRLFDVDLDGISLEPPGRDTTGDFIPSPDIDLATIGATLAAEPRSQYHYPTAASLASYNKRSASLRKMRPHRGEHVKRLKISYDTLGGLDHDQSPYAVNVPATQAQQQQPLATDSMATEVEKGQAVSSGYGFFSRLCEIMGMLVREVLFGSESHLWND